MNKDDKLLLKECVDLTISTIGSNLSKVDKEAKGKQRELLNTLLILHKKIDTIKTK